MTSTLKIDTITTLDGTGNITVDRPLAGSGAGLTSLPAANLTGALPAISGSNLTGVGKVVQVVTTQTGAVASNTGTIPHDDTIPTSGEGAEFMTLAITPTSATNRLIITMHAMLSCSAAQNERMLCLFQDSGSAAIAVMNSRQTSQTSASTDMTVQHSMIAGTTSSTTFKMRAGSGAGTTTFNGTGGNREFGGANVSSITIWEITV